VPVASDQVHHNDNDGQDQEDVDESAQSELGNDTKEP